MSKDTYLKDGLAKTALSDFVPSSDAEGGEGKVETKEPKVVKPSSGLKLGGGDPKCVVCSKTCYKMEAARYDQPVHQKCFNCKECGGSSM